MMVVGPDKDCPICKGDGHRIVDNDMKECACLYNKRVILRLGPEIATAPLIVDSPLYKPNPEHGGAPLVDKTRINAIVKGYWPDLLSHFKWTFIVKYNTVRLERFSFQIITDEKLRNVWFGKESNQARSKKQRDQDVATFNTVEDLLGTNYNLAIIRLGFLGWKNQAMGGILKEALMVRQALNLPTWLIEDPESPFEEGHYSWSRDVAEYIKDRFELIDLVGDAPPPKKEEPGMAMDEDDEPVVAAPVTRPSAKPPSKPKKEERVEREEKETPSFLSDPALMGTGGWKSQKKKKSGGGPV